MYLAFHCLLLPERRVVPDDKSTGVMFRTASLNQQGAAINGPLTRRLDQIHAGCLSMSGLEVRYGALHNLRFRVSYMITRLM